MKIRTKINLVLIIGFLIIILALGGVIGFVSSSQLRKLGEESISEINNAKAHEIITFLNGEKEVILSLSASTVFRDFLKLSEGSSQYNTEKIRTEQRLVRSIGSVTQIQELFILDKNGKIVASSSLSNYGDDKSEDLYFVEGKKGAYIKPFYFSETTKTNVYAVSAPIIDDISKNLLGVVVARMNPDNLYSVVGIEMSKTKTGENFLVSAEHFLISPTRYLSAENVLFKKIETQNVRDCFSPEEINAATMNGDKIYGTYSILSNYIDYRGIAIVGTHHYIPEAGWCLITKQDLSEISAPAYYLLRIFIIFSIVSLIIFVCVSYYISYKITKNMATLQKRAISVESGDLTQKIAIASNDEIGELSRSFESMVAAVKQSRADIDRKVAEQTKEIVEKQEYMENQQKATLNILEDVEEEKVKTQIEKDKIGAILLSIGDAVFVVDSNLNITMFNGIAENISGYSASEAIGKRYDKILKFVYESDKQKVNDVFIKKAIETGKIQEMSNHTLLITKEGKEVPVADSAAPLRDKNGNTTGCVVVFRDVAKEREIDKAKTEFVSLASHQLRTPLSAIRWYLEDLNSQEIGKLNKQQKDYIESGIASTKRLIAIVNGLLNISRLEMGRLTIDPKPTDLIKLVSETIKEHKKLAEERKVDLKMGNFPASMSEISIDPMLIRQVVANFISNAIKYAKPKAGKPVIVVKIDIVADKARVLVWNNGVAIPKKDQERLFQKFFRSESAVASETDGTGLGLYIAKMVVESSGGEIVFESKDEVGTTFGFTIPLSGSKAHKGDTTLST